MCKFGGDACRYCHDVKGFLKSKPPDIRDQCYMYASYGYCPSGIACRYGANHINEEYENVINYSVYDSKRMSSVSNTLPKTLQTELRKKKVTFVRTESYLMSLSDSETPPTCNDDVIPEVNIAEEIENNKSVEASDTTVTTPPPIENDTVSVSMVTTGPFTDEERVKLKPLEKKKVFY